MNEKAQTHSQMLTGMLAWSCAILSLPIILLAQAPAPEGKPTSHPAWWFEQEVIPRKDASVANPAWPADYKAAQDHAAITQGQLKWMAKGAYLHLQDVFTRPEVPSAISNAITTSQPWIDLTDLINGWDSSPNAADYAAANQGQVKHVAKHFYAVFQLQEVAYYTSAVGGWAEGDDYPWENSATSPDDHAAANSGQLKNLFAFDLTDWQATDSDPTDSDGDGIEDNWEIANGLDPSVDDSYLDADGDGWNNLTEFLASTDPQSSLAGPAETIDAATIQLTVHTPLL